MSVRRLIIGAGLGLLGCAAAAQEPLFRAESDLVVLHVNVFDRRSNAVAGLPPSAFHVFEDDQPQRIAFFSSTDVPVTVGLVVDNSTSMLTRRAMVLAGARAFIAASHPEDELFSIIFNEHVRHGLPPQAPFTQSPVLLESTLTRFPAGGRTALHDAVIAGLEHLEGATHQKRVLVVLSDGEDNASLHGAEDMVLRARRSKALIYAVSTGRLGPDRTNRGLLRRLAEASGGVAYFPDSEADVVATFTRIAENIRRGYSIGYVPTNTTHDGRYRRVRVTVEAQGRELRASVRDGYFAPKHEDGR